MKCICKDIYNIDGVVVGNVGDIIKIIDAIPNDKESYEDVDGYCDIINETTGETFNATWLDVDKAILGLIILSGENNMQKYIEYYYNNTSTEDHIKTDEFIREHKNEKNFYLSLYFSKKRLIKYQRAKSLFWDGCEQEFNLCKTEDLSKYNGLYDFETAFKLFKEFKLIDDGELIRLNYNTKYRDNTEFVLVRSFDNKKYYRED